jgi:hypothetical protein
LHLAEDQQWLLLVRQQITELTEQVEKQVAVQLPVLRERLAVAAKLEQKRPELAKRMYLAIISLYENQPWAREVVEEARSAIARDEITFSARE